MDTETLITTFPRLFHVAEAGAWESIKQHGLLSTSALLDVAGLEGSDRHAIESERRPAGVTLRGTSFVIRDQKPMSDNKLRRCLEGSGMSPRDWYELLNGLVFFWLAEDRLRTLLNARSYRDRAHDVLTLDTRSVVTAYAQQVRLSPINSGSTLFASAPARGPQTFRSIADYPFDSWQAKRGTQKAIAEFCVLRKVPDAHLHTRAVHRMKGAETQYRIY